MLCIVRRPEWGSSASAATLTVAVGRVRAAQSSCLATSKLRDDDAVPLQLRDVVLVLPVDLLALAAVAVVSERADDSCDDSVDDDPLDRLLAPPPPAAGARWVPAAAGARWVLAGRVSLA